MVLLPRLHKQIAIDRTPMKFVARHIINASKAPTYAATVMRYRGLQRHPLLDGVPDPLKINVLKRITYVPRHRFCYFRIPKAANSSVIMTLYSQVKPGKPHWPSLGNAGTMEAADLAKRLLHGLPDVKTLPSLFTFTFVRHPVARLVSAYLHKSPEARMQAVYPYFRIKPGTTDGFRHFLDCLDDGALHDDIHWAPQTGILPWDHSRYSFIGKVETIDRDLPALIDQLYGKPAGITNARSHRTDAASKVPDIIGRAERARIEKLYAADFDAFYPEG